MKNCKQCGTEYKRNPKYSNKQWVKSKFCSQVCQWKGKDNSNLVVARSLRSFMSISGKNSNWWKGGLTAINDKIRHSKEYKVWRMEVFERDNYTCQDCRQRGGDLQADHVMPFAYFPELRFNVNNGRTLCKPCHYKTPTYGEKAKQFAI